MRKSSCSLNTVKKDQEKNLFVPEKKRSQKTVICAPKVHLIDKIVFILDTLSIFNSNIKMCSRQIPCQSWGFFHYSGYKLPLFDKRKRERKKT